jgi:quinol monooxygenase YgiN
MIHVVAVITAKPGQRETILKEARVNLGAVRAENGCIEYGPVVDIGDGTFQTPLGPDTFMVIEKWTDIDALKAHAVAPHMKTFAARIKDLVAKRAIHVLTSAE